MPFMFMAPPSGEGGGAGGALVSFLPILIIFLIMYVLVLRPQSKRQKELAKMISELKRGDRVLTTGGVYGTVDRIKADEEVAVLKIADQVKIEVAKSAITSVVKKSREA